MTADDVRNEDWLRTRSWDLPGVETVEDLLQVLGVAGKPPTAQRARVGQFMQSPAWEAAPAVLAADTGSWLGAQRASFVEAEHPRGRGGRFIELYHGTTATAGEAIGEQGLTAETYSPYNRVLTKRKDEAAYFGTPKRGPRWQYGGAVVTVRVPEEQAAEFLDVNEQGLASLKKPLPVGMVHNVEIIRAKFGPSGPGGTVPGVEGLDQQTLRRIERLLGGLMPVDGDHPLAEVSRDGRWDPRKHPRVLHGEHGGQFAAKPTVGEAEPPDTYLAGQIHDWAAKAQRGDDDYAMLRQADDAYGKREYARAVNNLHAAATSAVNSPDPAGRDRAVELLGLAAMVRSQHDVPLDLGRLPDEILTERLTERPGGDFDARVVTDSLGSARQHVINGDYDKAVGELVAAASFRTRLGNHKGEARLTAISDALTKDYGQNARLARDMTAFTEKGADAVPDLLGGGEEHWNRTVKVKPELGQTPFGPAAADMAWDGQMRMTTGTASRIAGDLKGNGEVRDPRYFTIPLHELIHGVYGGRRQEAEQARLRSGRTQRDDAVLDVFHRLDLANASGGATPTAHHLDDVQEALGREKLPQSMKMEGTGVTQADIDSLVDRGFLEWTGTSSSSYTPEGKVIEHGRSWLRTSKAVNTDPQGPEPYDIHSRAYTNGSGVQAIEEGFTELGTIEHSSEYFTKTGIGRRASPYIAPVPGWKDGKPGPALKRQVTGKLRELAAQSGDEWVGQALSAWREGDVGLATIRLSTGRNRALGSGWVDQADEILNVMVKHPPSSPAWERKRAALQQRLSLEATKIQTRVIDAQTGLGQGGRAPAGGGYVQQVQDIAQLQRLQQAMSRAANDLEYGDTDGALEELGHLQHSGDTQFRDDAVSLGDELQALIETPSIKKETLAAWARRVNNHDAIVGGSGSYPEWTKQALLWCEAVAKAEGLRPGSAAFRRRVRELSDEVNREGPGRKIDAMVDQVLRLPHTDRWGRPGMMAHVRDTWLSDGAEQAFQGAHVRAVPTSDPAHGKLMKKYRGW